MPEHQQTQQSRESKPTFQKQTALVSQNSVSHPASIIQRARINPKSLTSADVLQLQRTIGNKAVGGLLSEIRNPSMVQQVPIQRQEVPEEETCPSCVQRQEIPEKEETLQGKFETIQRLEPQDEEKLQMKSVVQRQEMPEEKEKPLQGFFENDVKQATCLSCIQRKELEEEEPLQTKRENNTGMPDSLKAGVENLSGIDMSDVRVHYNSPKPANVGALAYTQGTNIHVAQGQERYLPHEAWHVVQQAQGRVRPTMQLKEGVEVNDDEELEREANEKGSRALNFGERNGLITAIISSFSSSDRNGMKNPVQLMRPHEEDKGRFFQIKVRGEIVIGKYIRSESEAHIFEYHQKEVRVNECDILGYKPTVGLMHPPGKVRPEEDKLSGRSVVFLSEADLSGVMARQRSDPAILDEMVVTTYEQKPDYKSFPQNFRDLESQGVPILRGFNVTKKEDLLKLLLMKRRAHIHFQCPRVTRGTRGYSTRKLVRDTVYIPRKIGRTDMTVSVTVPDPSVYKKRGFHKGTYGLEGDFLEQTERETGMKLSGSSEPKDLTKFGYTHRQNTCDSPAEAAHKLKMYEFKAQDSSSGREGDVKMVDGPEEGEEAERESLS